MPVEQEWRVGLCASCLKPLDPTEVGKKHVGYCSEHCRKQPRRSATFGRRYAMVEAPTR